MFFVLLLLGIIITLLVRVPFAAGKFQHQSLWPDTAARAMPAFERGAKKKRKKKRKTTNNRHLYHYCRECEEK